MSRLRYVVKHAGLRVVARKGVRALRRYGLGTARMINNLRTYADILVKHDVRGTLFVPASTLENHPGALRPFLREPFEWGLHGYVHIDYSLLSKKEQKEHLEKSHEIMVRNGIPSYGYRAPYGKFNSDTLALLRTGGILYDSSSCYIDDRFANSHEDAGVQMLIRQHYRAADEARPTVENGLIRIPFTIPDDEILVDRLNLSPAHVEKEWLGVLSRFNKKGKLFVLQLHPLRIKLLAGALSSLLAAAKKEGTQVLTLGEVAEGIRQGKSRRAEPMMCVTGDVDAMHVRELVR